MKSSSALEFFHIILPFSTVFTLCLEYLCVCGPLKFDQYEQGLTVSIAMTHSSGFELNLSLLKAISV